MNIINHRWLIRLFNINSKTGKIESFRKPGFLHFYMNKNYINIFTL